MKQSKIKVQKNRSYILVFILLFLISYPVSLFARENNDKTNDPEKEKITANAASIDLTPPLSMKFALGGYGSRMSKPAEGIHDRIHAKILVLKQGHKKYALISLDILGLPPNVKPELIKKLSQSGWRMDNIMLLPSHSHASLDMTALNDKNSLNSPQIGIYQPELLQFVINKLTELVKKADQNYKTVKIGTGSMLVDHMNRNRRGDPDVDRELTVTRVDLKDGNPLAVLVNWTAHPTFMGGKDMWVSAGWPGSLQRDLEEKIGKGVCVLYYNGAEGDQSPIGQGGENDYEKAEIYGKVMASKAYAVYKQIKPRSKIIFDYNYSTLKLPERRVHPSFMKTGGKEYNLTPEVLDIILKVMSPPSTDIGAVRIGDLLISGAPGELAGGLGLKIKDQLRKEGVKHPVIGGFANAWISYILSAHQYNNGAGYESSVSFYGETLGDVVTHGMLTTSSALIH